MPEFIVRAYRIREIASFSFDTDSVSFLIEDGPDGSDDVTARLPKTEQGESYVPEVGDYWVNPFGDGHIVRKKQFERTCRPFDKKAVSDFQSIQSRREMLAQVKPLLDTGQPVNGETENFINNGPEGKLV